MSLGISAAAWAAGAAIAATAVSAYGSYQTAEAQKKAQKQAQSAATDQKLQAEREFRRQNRKAPDVAGLMAANLANAQGGIGSTMLTGPSGIASGALSLGGSTLLGQ